MPQDPIPFWLITSSVLIGYAFLLFKSRLNARLVRRSAIIILTAGTALFMYGYHLEGYNEGILTSFLRALIDSIKLFLYDCNFPEIEEAQREPLFTDLMILTFFAAMLTSLSAIIMLFGKRAMTVIILHMKRQPFRHIFVGVNPKAEMVANGISDEDIAFIEFPGDSKDEEMSVKSVLKRKGTRFIS